jgi:putative restriction endonuclease
LSDLRRGAAGELENSFAKAFEKDPRLIGQVVRLLLDSNFPPSLQADILAAVGLEIEPTELAGVVLDFARRKRDPAFREAVLLAYEYRCGICGYDGQLMREAVGVDAAHVRWWAADGPDEVTNGLALCSLHHKLLDRGAIGLTADHRVAVSAHFIGRSDIAEQMVLSLVGRDVDKPQPGQSRPMPEHVRWHTREVFRSPARQAAG